MTRKVDLKNRLKTNKTDRGVKERFKHFKTKLNTQLLFDTVPVKVY